MEQFASDVAILLLVGTPFLVFAKFVHSLATRRLTFFSRGSRRAKAEPVVWLLLATVDSHTVALWSGFALQAEDVCARYRPALGENVHISSGGFFDYPVHAQCVWQGGESVSITPWLPNVATVVFLAAAVAVGAHAIVRARYHRRAQQLNSDYRGDQ